MPLFSESSLSKLATCHPELQMIFHEVIKYWDCSVTCGYRNEKDQNDAFAAGNTKLKFPNGNHNQQPSLAVDVMPFPAPDWKNLNDFVYFGGFVMGIAIMCKQQGLMHYDLRYGADWNRNQRISDERFLDAVHFELIT